MTDFDRAARRLRALGYHDVERYGSGGLSAVHGRWRWFFYNLAALSRLAARARSVRSPYRRRCR